MRELFTPYARVSDRQMQIATVLLALTLLLLWSLKLHPLLPTPLEVWDRWTYQVTTQGLFHEIWVSLKLNLEALLLSTIITALFSYGQVIPVVRILVGWMENFRLISATALAFPMVVLIDDPHWVKVFALSFGMLPYLLSGLASSVRSIEDKNINHARTLRLGHWGTTWQVIVRGRLFDLFESVRQNFTIGWAMTVGIEAWVRSEGGVGLMIVEQAKYLRLADMFAILLTVFMVGMFENYLIRLGQRACCPHASIGKGVFG